ncbi:hypothetical protein [Lederbergia citri]|uniref:Uncharacterized protein n=1 Tax=Lederbergia citri TaxID=2833580 RepID=A0A942TB82_9BACI|nr:hypothetical protein [Lederbergia citri]MBS4194651.1 hypothetical protein [Lederbergia citri]
MDIKDRGMKKWNGFMMPEHIGELHDMWDEYQKDLSTAPFSDSREPIVHQGHEYDYSFGRRGFHTLIYEKFPPGNFFI